MKIADHDTGEVVFEGLSNQEPSRPDIIASIMQAIQQNSVERAIYIRLKQLGAYAFPHKNTVHAVVEPDTAEADYKTSEEKLKIVIDALHELIATKNKTTKKLAQDVLDKIQ